MEINIKKMSDIDAEAKGIKNWPVWQKEVSTFDYFYDEKEDCYFLQGEVEVETDNGKKVRIQKGDFVSFPKGLKCRWDIKEAVRKHYRFGD